MESNSIINLSRKFIELHIVLKVFLVLLFSFFSHLSFKFFIYLGLLNYTRENNIEFPSHYEFDISILYTSFYMLLFFYVLLSCNSFFFMLHMCSNKTNDTGFISRSSKIIHVYIMENIKNKITPKLILPAILIAYTVLYFFYKYWIFNIFMILIILPFILAIVFSKFIKRELYRGLIFIPILILTSSLYTTSDKLISAHLRDMNIGGKIDVSLVLYDKNKVINGSLLLSTKSYIILSQNSELVTKKINKKDIKFVKYLPNKENIFKLE